MLNEEQVAQSFKVDAEGRLVFYPFGMIGKGRILPDRATAAAVYARQKFLYQLAMVGAGALLLVYNTIGFVWMVGGLAVLCLVLWVCMYPMIRHLPTSDDEYDFGASVQADTRFGLRRLTLVSLIFVAGSALILLVGKPEDRWIGFAGIAFFGTAFLMFVWRIVSRKRRPGMVAEEAVRRRSSRRSRDDSATVSRKSQGFGKRNKPL